MRNLLKLALLSAVAMVVVSCGKDPEEPRPTPLPDTGIILSTSALEFFESGDTKTVEVTSEIAWTATPSEPWIEIRQNDTNIEVTVRGYSGVDRSGEITIDNGHAEEAKTIAVTQTDRGVRFEALNYKPPYPNGIEGVFEIELHFIERPDAEGNAADCRYVVLDVITPRVGMDKASLEIAPGTYDTRMSFSQPYGLHPNYSFLNVYEGRSIATGQLLKGGSMTVEGNSISGYEIRFDLILEDPRDDTKTVPFKGFYEGPLFMENTYALSTFDADHAIVDLADGSLAWGGDERGDGTHVWYLDMVTAGMIDDGQNTIANGDHLRTLLYSDASAGDGRTLPAGTYTIDDTEAAGTVYYGDKGTQFGSWIFNYVDGGMDEKAPLSSGSIEVSRSGSVYTIEIAARDNLGNAITGTYTGPLAWSAI